MTTQGITQQSSYQRRRHVNHIPVHFEIPADKPEKLAEFYTKLFGWKIEKVPEMDYWMVQAAPQGEGVNGGMMTRQAPGQQMTVYFLVESVNDYAAKVQSLGGKVLVPKQEVMGMGWFAICEDPQGAVFAIWEAAEGAM
jgi:uncharacterized protein